MWNYNTFSRDGLIKFIFELYDLDASASLDVDEIKRMFTEMCGEEFARTERSVLLLERIEMLGTGAIRKDQFVSFVSKNQGVLMPAYVPTAAPADSRNLRISPSGTTCNALCRRRWAAPTSGSA